MKKNSDAARRAKSRNEPSKKQRSGANPLVEYVRRRGHETKVETNGALKLKPAAEYLGGLSKPTMYRLVEKGLLRPNRSVRHLLFTRAELDRFLTRRPATVIADGRICRTLDTNQTNPAAQLNNEFPCISIETIEELTRRNLLHFGDDYWRFGDDSNGVMRKLNTRHKWMRVDNSGAAWHRLIGLDDVIAHERKYVLLAIEGSKDALAAAELAHRVGILPQTGVMCAPINGIFREPFRLQSYRGYGR